MTVLFTFTLGSPVLAMWALPCANLARDAVKLLAGKPAPAQLDSKDTRGLSYRLLTAAGQAHIRQTLRSICVPCIWRQPSSLYQPHPLTPSVVPEQNTDCVRGHERVARKCARECMLARNLAKRLSGGSRQDPIVRLLCCENHLVATILMTYACRVQAAMVAGLLAMPADQQPRAQRQADQLGLLPVRILARALVGTYLN